MPSDAALTAAVAAAIERHGVEVEIERAARGSLEPIPGRSVQRGTQSAARSGTFKAIFGPKREIYDQDLVSEVEFDLIVAPAGFAPEAGDTVEGGKILEVETIQPGGTVVLYICRVSQ